jgi:hypothetical protein
MPQPAPGPQRSRASRSPGAVVLAVVLDALLVLAFVLIGRESHRVADPIGGALVTFWPFAVGLVIGWFACLAWRRPMTLWPTGVVVWASTLVLGMVLRVVSAQGIAVSFVIVAGMVLAAFLIGWRAIAALVTTVHRRATS